MSNFKFTSLGVMLDMSANAVMTPDTLKKFMKLLKRMGYNTLLLSLEGACPTEKDPYIGYMRSKYSKEELSDIAAYAKSIHLELIPAIRSLAVGNVFNKWDCYPKDRPNVLSADKDATYELVERMIAYLSEIFTSKKIHIGLEFDKEIGRGTYLNNNGYVERCDIVLGHIRRVNEICKRYGVTALAYSDMLSTDAKHLKAYPKSALPVCNIASVKGREELKGEIENTRLLSSRAWVASRFFGNTGLIPNNRLSIKNAVSAIDACREAGCRNYYVNIAVEDGAECSPFALLPALVYAAQYAKGITDEESIKAKFKSVVGMNYDEFILIDAPNAIAGNEKESDIPCNPSKYMLYSDLFNGFLDRTVKEGGNDKYAIYAEKLRKVSRRSRKYGYIFTSAAALCDLLAVKYELGVKTRWSYNKGRKWDLLLYANRDYTELLTLIRRYTEALSAQWNTENKPCGFDVHEIRLAGVSARAESCRRRLLEYTDGEADEIIELKCEILPYKGGIDGESICFNDFKDNVTACVYTL